MRHPLHLGHVLLLGARISLAMSRAMLSLFPIGISGNPILKSIGFVAA